MLVKEQYFFGVISIMYILFIVRRFSHCDWLAYVDMDIIFSFVRYVTLVCQSGYEIEKKKNKTGNVRTKLR